LSFTTPHARRSALVSSRPPEAVLANLAIQRLRRDAQYLGGFALMPLALEQDGFDVAALQLLECQLSADERRWRARRGGQVERKILRANHAATCEKNGALDDVPELADVAGPLILLQQRARVRRQRRCVAAAKPR